MVNNHWLVVWNHGILLLSRNSWEWNNHPNWLLTNEYIFQRGRLKPPTSSNNVVTQHLDDSVFFAKNTWDIATNAVDQRTDTCIWDMTFLSKPNGLWHWVCWFAPWHALYGWDRSHFGPRFLPVFWSSYPHCITGNLTTGTRING